jgi:hypothetical protein
VSICQYLLFGIPFALRALWAFWALRFASRRWDSAKSASNFPSRSAAFDSFLRRAVGYRKLIIGLWQPEQVDRFGLMTVRYILDIQTDRQRHVARVFFSPFASVAFVSSGWR